MYRISVYWSCLFLFHCFISCYSHLLVCFLPLQLACLPQAPQGNSHSYTWEHRRTLTSTLLSHDLNRNVLSWRVSEALRDYNESILLDRWWSWCILTTGSHQHNRAHAQAPRAASWFITIQISGSLAVYLMTRSLGTLILASSLGFLLQHCSW